MTMCVCACVWAHTHTHAHTFMHTHPFHHTKPKVKHTRTSSDASGLMWTSLRPLSLLGSHRKPCVWSSILSKKTISSQRSKLHLVSLFSFGAVLYPLYETVLSGASVSHLPIKRSRFRMQIWFIFYDLLGQTPNFADKETEVSRRPGIWDAPVSLKVTKSTVEVCGHLQMYGLRLRGKQIVLSGLEIQCHL